MRLHSSLGPARTTLSAVAEEAGVSRPTLYSHFPDEASLIQACTTHWLSQDPPPDPTGWLAVADPVERMRVALREIYSHYERNEEMTDHVLRDMDLVETMKSFNKPLIEGGFAAMTDTLASAFEDGPPITGQRRAMISLAISFDTWKQLARVNQLTTEEAVRLMVHSVQCVPRDIELPD